LRAGLVVLQFAISIVLLIVTSGIHRQTEFARNVDRGFDTEQMVVLSGSAADGLGPSFGALRERLLDNPEITDVLVGSLRPGRGGTRTVRYEGGSPDGREIPTSGVDYGFFEAHGIEVVAGRTFSEERGTDAFVLPEAGRRTTGAYMLSELAARELGWTPTEAIDKWFETDFAGDFSSSVRGPVIGVVKDVFTNSAREPLQPVVYFAARDSWAGAGAPYFTDATVRITGNRIAETLAYIDAAWKELAPDMPLVRSFLDDRFAALYRNEERQATMLGAFSLLAVFVACLGLVGLASFATERRIKEIGIRKAIGGGVVDIVVLFCGEFGRLVLVANLVAWPVAYLAMQRWLAGFAYRADLSLWIFVGSAALAFVFAAVTVGAVAARAASVKPVRALRYE
jgi:putative ABC transport system permease protein